MKLSTTELQVVGAIILYIAFFTHPPPTHLKDFLSSPVGHGIALIGVLYVVVYQSAVVGIFLALAYVMTATSVTEYLDPKEQAPKKDEQPKSTGVPLAMLKGVLADGLKKGGRLEQTAGKSDTTKPVSKTTPAPKSSTTVEHFASFE